MQQQATTEKYTKIADLRPYMKGLNCIFIVLEKGNVTKTKDEHLLAHALVADNTASVHLSLWDTAADWLQPGDIIRLRGGYSTIFKNSLILYAGRYGNVTRIGEFNMVFVETPNMSSLQWTADPNNPSNMIPSSTSSLTTVASTPFNSTTT